MRWLRFSSFDLQMKMLFELFYSDERDICAFYRLRPAQFLTTESKVFVLFIQLEEESETEKCQRQYEDTGRVTKF